MKLMPTDLAWLAGLLEGEGSFLRGPPCEPNHPRIALEMVDLDIVNRVAGMLAVKSHATKRHLRRPEWRPTFRLVLKGTRAVALMKVLRPLMGTRRQKQIDAAVASHNPKNYRKLTEAQVKRIRRTSEPSEVLGSKLGVSGNVIRRIRRGEIWKTA